MSIKMLFIKSSLGAHVEGSSLALLPVSLYPVSQLSIVEKQLKR